MTSNEFTHKRIGLARWLRASMAIRSAEVENAFLSVPREEFFPIHLQSHAYDDSAYPLGAGQSVSQPSTIAPMLEMLNVRAGMKVLEIGSGSGYVLALLSSLAGKKGKVFGVEISGELCKSSRIALKKIKCDARVVQGDGTKGLASGGKFDRILVSAACPFLPKPLFGQLKNKGIAVAPIGDRYNQQLEALHKAGGKIISRETAPGFYVFVPLLGAFLHA